MNKEAALSGRIGSGSPGRLFRKALLLALLLAPACQEPLPGRAGGDDSRALEDEDSTGVAICDSYLEQYEACVIPRLPPSQVNRHLTGIQRQREAWRDLASSAAKRESLSRICRAAVETARQEFPGCTFSPS
jgi:hypothetical protein